LAGSLAEAQRAMCASRAGPQSVVKMLDMCRLLQEGSTAAQVARGRCPLSLVLQLMALPAKS
jgi:hypothetical protein